MPRAAADGVPRAAAALCACTRPACDRAGRRADLPEELAAYLFSEADYDHPFTWDADPDDEEDEEDVPTE